MTTSGRKAVTLARTAAPLPPAGTSAADAIYRSLFDSFGPDSGDRISPLEVLARLERCGLQPDDPRIAEALTALTGDGGRSRQISFGQFKALARRGSSLIKRAVEGNLAVPDFAALTADIERMYHELLPVTSGQVAGYIPQLARVDPDQLAIAVCTVDGQRFSVGDAAAAFCLQSVSKTVSYCLALDEHGNSVRGIEFCRKLAAAYQVHVFDSLVTGRGRTGKRDPRRKKNQTRTEAVVALTWAASQGDLNEVRALIASGVEPGTADYDGRTPLHLAAAEGQTEIVRYLLAAGADPQPADRWGGTPLTDAETGGHTQIADLLTKAAHNKKEVAV